MRPAATPIEAKADEVLRSTDCMRVPVPVDRVALCLGLQVEATELGDDVSGVLVVENGRGTIGVNASHPHVRQRFSVAHEIAHYVLHLNAGHLFIDKQYTAVYRRDQRSSSGEHLREIQANQFAAALLMPEALILQEMQTMEFDLAAETEDGLAALSRKFQVSTQALSFRLAHLGIFPIDGS